MSKLEQLIAEYCPDGVKFAKLGEKVTIMRGASPRPINSYITTNADGVNWIKIGDVEQNAKYVTQTLQRITSAGAEKSRLLKKGDFVLSNSMSFGRPYILAIDGCIHDGWIAISNIEEVYDADFLYYLLNSRTVQDYWEKVVPVGTIRNLNADIVRSTPVPVPPLPVQIEIARILDNFAEITANLKTELAAELPARKKQYEYYRSILMTNTDVPMKKLGEIGRVAMCKRIMKAETMSEGNVPFYKIGTFGKMPDAYISTETYEQYKRDYSYPKKGDVLISAAGTIGRVVIFNGEPAYYQDSNIVWLEHDESQALNKYLFYCYQLSPWHISTGGTIARLYNDNISNAKIPLPNLEEQARIVEILDKFNALTTEITDSLTVEIEARQKQYEYYRDKLLSFKEKIA